jgi:hypothetical protein
VGAFEGEGRQAFEEPRVLLLGDIGYHDDVGRRVDRLRVKRVIVNAIGWMILMFGAA